MPAFTDITAVSGTAGPNHFGGHGAQFADVDRDGFSDFYVTMNETGFGDMAELFYRNIDGTAFSEEAAARGVDNFDTGSHGGVFADFDNDGYFDLFNGSYDQNRIYRNDGAGRFEERTVQAGLPSRSWPTRGVAAFDMDLDGDLDIAAINGYLGSGDPAQERNEFYRNDGGFTFTAVNTEPLFSAAGGQGITDTDFDNDGYIDLFVANRSGPVVILRNVAGTGFEIVAPASMGIAHFAGDGISVGDANNDGFLDLLLDNEFYLADGDGTFTHRQTLSGPRIPYMGGFADLDNDGDLDVVIPGANFVYWNDGAGVFTASAVFSLGEIDDPRSVAFSDIDNDGDSDFFYAQKRTFNILVRNDLASTNRWLKVLLYRESGQIGAFGARIFAYEAGGLGDPGRLVTWREIRSQDGYLSQSDPRVVLGLGGNDRVDVRVVFPGGGEVTLLDVAAGQSLEIEECGSASCGPVDTVPPTRPANLAASAISDSAIELQWDAASDASGISHYVLERDGEPIVEMSGTRVVDSGLTPATAYRYRVFAVDNNSLSSDPSDAIDVATRDDETPPTRPGNLAGTSQSDSRIDLSWTASADNVGVAGYTVFRDTQAIATVTQAAYSDSGLAADTQYRYTVTAFDAAGNESEASLPVDVTTEAAAPPPVTTPPPPPTPTPPPEPASSGGGSFSSAGVLALLAAAVHARRRARRGAEL